MRKLSLLVPCLFFSLITKAQGKVPAYPLITHNTYFNIWSFSNGLTSSATENRTAKEQSLLGVIKVDDKFYLFRAEETKTYKTILSATEELTYQASKSRIK